jgi:hypothetical protein
MRLLEINRYDPLNRNFSDEMYFGDGSRISGALTITGNTWTYAEKWAVAGEHYQVEDSFVLAPDVTTGTDKVEISSDATTWTPFSETKWAKVKPAAKKSLAADRASQKPETHCCTGRPLPQSQTGRPAFSFGYILDGAMGTSESYIPKWHDAGFSAITSELAC